MVANSKYNLYSVVVENGGGGFKFFACQRFFSYKIMHKTLFVNHVSIPVTIGCKSLKVGKSIGAYYCSRL
jgi:hypothetical protein